jgi:hypothetical protein
MRPLLPLQTIGDISKPNPPERTACFFVGSSR